MVALVCCALLAGLGALGCAKLESLDKKIDRLLNLLNGAAHRTRGPVIPRARSRPGDSRCVGIV